MADIQCAEPQRTCTVCKAVVASYPEGMCCHCQELPWPVADAARLDASAERGADRTHQAKVLLHTLALALRHVLDLPAGSNKGFMAGVHLSAARQALARYDEFFTPANGDGLSTNDSEWLVEGMIRSANAESGKS